MVDVCLILEGTYPYVSGGVSSWVHQLVTNLSNTSFAILHLSANQDAAREFKYKPPSNVKIFQEIFLHDYHYPDKPDFKSLAKNWKPEYLKHHKEFHQGKYGFLSHIVKQFHSVHPKLSFEEMTFSKPSWEMVKELYQGSAPDQSFLDYFWTWRFTHMPLFKILGHQFPAASVYHTVSTGYAGLCSAVAKIKTGAPVILTEHGIYTRERKIEIQEADWIYRSETLIEAEEKKDFFKKIGIVVGDRDLSIEMLKKGEICIAMPGGALEWGKSSRHKYQLMWEDHMGFIIVALKAKVPIIPIVTI
ncbi:MAG: GT4 family glycosyltransferase PelF, partial [Fibrobacteria bacterium]|nr:GT4 family glycosyltransferase PelF [Fibrobacteria bacterium]